MTGPNSLTFFEATGDFFALADPSISGVLNSPIVQPISALVTFTPRIKQGQLLYITDYLVTTAYNAEQTVFLLGQPNSGIWTLEFGGQLTPTTGPSNLAAAGSGSGGTLAAGSYYYVVTAVYATGETAASNETTVTTTGSSSSAALTWSAISGITVNNVTYPPTNYKIYRGTSAGGENKLLSTVSGTTLTYTDTGSTGTTAAVPQALQWNATPSQVQTALEALSTIGSGNVTVIADIEPQAYDVEFTNSLGLQTIPVLVGNADLLANNEGTGFCEITVAATAMGSPEVTSNIALAIPPLQARIYNGILSTIDRVDTPGFQLLSNSAIINLDTQLIYDVAFTNVTYNGASQKIAPYAFVAPTDDTGICLTDPNLEMLPYVAPTQPPYTEIWTPPGSTPLNAVYALADANRGTSDNWRTRAAARQRAGGRAG